MNLVKKYLARVKQFYNLLKRILIINPGTLMMKTLSVAMCIALTLMLFITAKTDNNLAEKNNDESQCTKTIQAPMNYVIPSTTSGVTKDINEYLYQCSTEDKAQIKDNGDILVGVGTDDSKDTETEEIRQEPMRENKLYRIVDGNYVFTLEDEYQDYLWEMCKKYEIPEYYELLLAQMYHESQYVTDCISGSNDYGLMQINTCNHGWLSERLGSNDFLNPYVNIESGVLMMSDLLNRYDDVQKALVCYNRGESAVINGTYSTSYSRCIIDDMKLLIEK